MYHIENYLLHDQIISDVAKSIALGHSISPSEVEEKLNIAARQVVPTMLIHRMRSHVNSKLVQSISLGFSPDTLTIGNELHNAASRSAKKISELINGPLSESSLLDFEQSLRTEYEKCFGDGTWRSKIPGREILKRFVDLAKIPVGYEVFRNLLVQRMVELSYKPEGMRDIIMKIASN